MYFWCNTFSLRFSQGQPRGSHALRRMARISPSSKFPQMMSALTDERNSSGIWIKKPTIHPCIPLKQGLRSKHVPQHPWTCTVGLRHSSKSSGLKVHYAGNTTREVVTEGWLSRLATLHSHLDRDINVDSAVNVFVRMHLVDRSFTPTIPPPPPPNTIKTANEGRFRLNVDSPYGERAQSTALTRAPPRRPAQPRRDFILNLSMRESKASPVVVCLHHAG